MNSDDEEEATAAAAAALDAKLGQLVREYGADAVRRRCASAVTTASSESATAATATAEEEIAMKTAMLDSSFDAMFAVDQAGIIRTVNRAAVEQFGYDDKSDMVGQNIKVICGGGHAARHQSYIERYLKTGVTKLIGTQREMPARRQDGTEFPCVLGFQVIRSSGGTGESNRNDQQQQQQLFFASIRDITSEKAARETLAQNLRMKKVRAAILDAAMDPIFATDNRGIVQIANQKAADVFGYDSTQDMIGMNVKDIVGGGHADMHDGYVKKYCETQEHKYLKMRREVLARRKDGSEFPAMLGLEYVKVDHDDDDDEGEEGTHSAMVVAFLQDLTHQKRAFELEVEKRAAEELLLNMLPEEIAYRLQSAPSDHIADHHERATVLFADIVGFTSMSSRMLPVDVVRMLNDLFTRFDVLVDRYRLNKIKTIGDCYMVTSIPGKQEDSSSCAAVCHFAFDMIEELRRYNDDVHSEMSATPLDLRLGINTGPVVAGVVGTKRFLYDIWGDAVNLASRMESTGVPGRIQVTKDVVDLVPAEEFRIQSRGEIQVKGKGVMETFFLVERHGGRERTVAERQRCT